MESHVRERRAVRPVSEAGVSPLGVEYVNNFNERIHKDWVSPLFSSIVYRTDDIHKAMRAWDKLDVGGVVVGDVPSWRVDNMPYGGVKDSGLGREGGTHGYDAYTELKSIIIETNPGASAPLFRR